MYLLYICTGLNTYRDLVNYSMIGITASTYTNDNVSYFLCQAKVDLFMQNNNKMQMSLCECILGIYVLKNVYLITIPCEIQCKVHKFYDCAMCALILSLWYLSVLKKSI